ncbi:amino-acid N-acetyltransferase [Snodgrassella alvi]|jgi:amino-acid N-acetyltransferase|uniref:Amino-acid acetyltransferase n=1 Tax=Snodgrassella alvi TaxID=1196083 RepID=A0A2N9XUJ1_9NEIS|nr:amino-acid N-acetyltransferase [Snodgrassella alvi]PIT53033.1 amino-acid N-acetyltransferase [Snodgrassella alvi]
MNTRSGNQEFFHNNQFIHDFRQASPYIHYFNGKTLVLAISSHVLVSDKLAALAADILLLTSLGMRLVIIHGCSQYIQAIAGRSTAISIDENPITDEAALELVKQASGIARFNLEAALSMIPTQIMEHSTPNIRIAGGNFLRAKPLGVINGIDMCYSGCVRKVDATAIEERLAHNQLVLISPIGHSLSGQCYRLQVNEVAQAVSEAISAEKLIFLGTQQGLLDEQQQTISKLNCIEIRQLLARNITDKRQTELLQTAAHVLEHSVQRVHVLSGLQDGSLLQELFTREGSGTAMAKAPFMRIRPAENKDIGEILQLIAPLEAAGILLPRDSEYMENHIHEFSVLEQDCYVYGCVALHVYPEENAGELACLIVSPDARARGYGELLLAHVIKQAQELQLQALFALSTHTGDWFVERGFSSATLAQLPAKRQQQYTSNKRRSKIFRRQL